MVQSLKGILADRSEGEIYATLCDCGMDPDIAVERLISQDTFHEVRRKRDRKKETKVNHETRPRPFQKYTYRGYRPYRRFQRPCKKGTRDASSTKLISLGCQDK